MRHFAVALLVVAHVEVGCGSGSSHAPAVGDPVPQIGNVLVTSSGELPAERQQRSRSSAVPSC